MKHLPGVIFAAVILALGSLFQLLMAAAMVFAGAAQKAPLHPSDGLSATAVPPTPAWLPAFMYWIGVFFVLLAVWGIVTTVGLFRMRPWARYSTLVIGGCLVLVGLPSMLMMVIMTIVSLPPPATIDPSQVHMFQTMYRVVIGIGAAFYAVIAAIGISWLVYFNRRKVREAFAGAQSQFAESRRPFLISAVAVLLMFGAPSCLLMAFLPFPGAFLGFTLHGWQKAVIFLVYGAVITAAGIGLWQLKEWGRRLALAMQIVGLIQFAVYTVRPSLRTSYSEEVNKMMGVAQNQVSPQFQNTMYAVTFGFSALFLIAIMAILHRYRNAFKPPAAKPPTASLQSAPGILSETNSLLTPDQSPDNT